MSWIVVAISLSFVLLIATATLLWLSKPDSLADEREAEMLLLKAVSKRR